MLADAMLIPKQYWKIKRMVGRNQLRLAECSRHPDTAINCGMT
jgi:hypothetical protein